MNKELTAIKKRMNDMCDSLAKDTANYTDKVNKTKETVSKENDRMQIALDNDNVEEYAAAKRSKEDAEAELDFYTRKLEGCTMSARITIEDSNRVFNDIVRAQESIEREYGKRALKFVEQLLKLRDEYNAEIEEAESLANEWGNNIRPYSSVAIVSGKEVVNKLYRRQFEDKGLAELISELEPLTRKYA